MPRVRHHSRVKSVLRRSHLPALAPLVIALLGLLAAVVACGPTANAIRPTLPPRTLTPDGGFTSPPGTPSGITPSVAPASSYTPPPAGVAQPMTSFPQGSAYEVAAVTTTPTGFVAIGFAGAGQGYYGLHQGVIWTSSDGMTWQQQVDPAFVDVDPTYVAAMGNDVYVFGYYTNCSDMDDECELDANAGMVIFRSSSGGPWQQLAQTTDILNAEFDGVRVWNDTLVAWGAAADNDVTTTLWTSKDGLTWAPTTNLAGLDPISAVGVGGPGLVAFGSQYIDTIDNTQLMVATSRDGIAFSSATAPTVTGASVTDAVAGPGGMAAIGYIESDTDPSTGVAMSSADGTTWTVASSSDTTFSNTQLNDIHSSASAYVTVGSSVDDTDFSLQTAGIWVSGDGKTWRSLGNFGGQFSQYGGSALGPTGLVLFTANEQDTNDGSDINSTIHGWFVPSAQLVP